MSNYPSNYIDECCFGSWLEIEKPENKPIVPDIEKPLNTCNSFEDLNYIDSQYFETTDSNSFSSSGVSPPIISSDSSLEDDSLDFIDSQYFVNSSSPNPNILTVQNPMHTIITRSFHNSANIYLTSHKRENIRDSGSTEFSPLRPDRDSLPTIVSVGSTNHRQTNGHRHNKPNQRIPVNDPPINASEALPPESAAEMVQRLRREGETSAVDSKGFRLYRREDCTPIGRMTREQLVQHLVRDCLIYADAQLVALNKPYGLHVTRGQGVGLSIKDLLPDLRKALEKEYSLPPAIPSPSSASTGPSHIAPRLHLVHRLDRDTTGIIILARSVSAFDELKAHFYERRVQKRYWCLLSRIPSLEAGVIDVPLAEGFINGIYKLFPRPHDEPGTAESAASRRRRGPEREAVTEFSVRSSNEETGTALVECFAQTGVRHQIRVHLSMVLGCPIIGDHKYSHVTKLAPQKLPTLALRAMHMRQARVRTLPLHLHARELVLPEYFAHRQNRLGPQRDLVLRARLPDFFLKTMRLLRITAH